MYFLLWIPPRDQEKCFIIKYCIFMAKCLNVHIQWSQKRENNEKHEVISDQVRVLLLHELQKEEREGEREGNLKQTIKMFKT